jgi:DNA-binding NarL/FixJ family response regulator
MEPLTSRQREILQLVAEGHSSNQIAGILVASVKTIDSHRANIMERLEIHNVAGLVRYAIRRGLASADK